MTSSYTHCQWCGALTHTDDAIRIDIHHRCVTTLRVACSTTCLIKLIPHAIKGPPMTFNKDAARGRRVMSCFEVVNIARCHEHGIHGARDHCYVCGVRCEQVPFVGAAALDRIDELEAALRGARNELGVPGDDYPAPVANAVAIIERALEGS